MKTFLLWLSFCLCVTAVHSAVPSSTAARSTAVRSDDPSGIKFFSGSWNDVLAEAKRRNKPVFVDIYTTWCGPCKLMAKEAFPDPTVGEKFNASFVSYQIDAEKGEGIDVAKKYAVDAYPTALYVSANGDLIHRAIGYGGIKGMLEEAEKALTASKDPNTLAAMEKAYAAGKRDTDFLATYLKKRAAIGMPNSDALDAYLKVVPQIDWSSDDNLSIISGNAKAYSKPAMMVLIQKMEQLKSVDTPDVIELRNKIGGGVYTMNNDLYKQAITTGDERLLENVINNNRIYLAAARSEPIPTEQGQQIDTGYRLRFYQQTKNYNKYRPLAVAEATKLMNVSADSVKARNETGYKRFQQQTAAMPDSVKNSDNFRKYAANMQNAETDRIAMNLNNLAWTYYENMPDKKDLAQALTWSVKSLTYKRVPVYLDTYAHLLGKLGRQSEAVKIEREALNKAKATGEDTAEYEKGLAELNKK